jgi:hypothetical protein
MALSTRPSSPTASAEGVANAGHRSASPPAQPLTKRDRRRAGLEERYIQLTDSFDQNRDPHFREQIKARQIDMALILAADPYKPEPLDDSGDDFAKMVEQSGIAGSHPGATNRGSLSGQYYNEYVQAVNASKESRDVDLTALVVS